VSGRYVALMRGINVGGKHRLPMKDLAAIFGTCGCEDVRTYIQSGNVVFRAAASLAKQVPARVERAVADRFGFESPVVLRSAAELAAVVDHLPFPKAEVGIVNVGFLADRPQAVRAGKLDPERSPGDTFVLRGRELYLRLPNGSARSKLTTNYFDSTLGTVSTFRNWRTVLQLLDMTR